MNNNLLLLHGALGSKDQFTKLAQLLAPTFKAYSFNFSGHGGRKADNPFSIELFINDTLNFLKTNALDTVNIFGYSMGGYVALQLARDYPSLVGKIITLGTKFNWTKESAEKEIRLFDPEVVEQKVPKFAELLKTRHFPMDWKEIMKKTALMMSELGNGSAMKADDFRKIENSVLISLGSEDNMVTQAESLEVVSFLKNGSFQLINGFKHPIESVNVEILAQKITEYLQSGNLLFETSSRTGDEKLTNDESRIPINSHD